MKPAHVIKAIATLVKANKVVYLEGKPGIGKTSFPKQAAIQNGWDYKVLPPAPTIDPVDLRGAIKVITKQDIAEFNLPAETLGHTMAFPPDFLPTVAEKITIVVIDDVPTATPAVQATLFQLLLERRLGNYIVPANVRFVLTGNRVEDRAGANRTLTALDSRVCRIGVDVSSEDWIDWAITNDIAPEVVAYHRFTKGDNLWQFDPTKKVNPLPRTWEFLSDTFKVAPPAEIAHETYAGFVGEEQAAGFIGFLQVLNDLPNPKDCLAFPETAPTPPDVGAQLCLWGARARLVEDDTVPAFLTYVARLGGEYEHLAVADLVKVKPSTKETKAFSKWFLANEDTFNPTKK